MKINTTTLRCRAGRSVLMILAGLGLTGSVFAVGNGNPLPQPTAWAGCEKFYSVVTDTSFKPNGNAFDELYMMGEGNFFDDGTPLISDAAPNDTDFNGGRWHVNVLKDDVDPSKYEDACEVGDLDLNDFMPVPVYFECPLLPMRGNGNRNQ